jgi:hypothetical protein
MGTDEANPVTIIAALRSYLAHKSTVVPVRTSVTVTGVAEKYADLR